MPPGFSSDLLFLNPPSLFNQPRARSASRKKAFNLGAGVGTRRAHASHSWVPRTKLATTYQPTNLATVNPLAIGPLSPPAAPPIPRCCWHMYVTLRSEELGHLAVWTRVLRHQVLEERPGVSGELTNDSPLTCIVTNQVTTMGGRTAARQAPLLCLAY